MVATNIPSSFNGSAVLSSTDGGTTTTGGQFRGGIDTLVITSETSETLEGTSLQAARAKVDRAGLSVTLVVGRLSRSVGRLAGRGSGSGGSGVTLEIVSVPVPSLGALRRRHLRRRVVGNTASFASVPAPARGRALVATWRRRGCGRSTVRETAVLLTKASE